MSFLSRRRVVQAMATFVPLASCAPNDADLGITDSYLLFATPDGPDRGVHPVSRTARGVPTLQSELDRGFASEILSTLYLCKHFLRDAAPAGRRFSESARAYANRATILLLDSGETAAFGRGLRFQRTLRAPIARPDLVWLGLRSEFDGDPALVQTLTGRFGAHLAALASTAGEFNTPPNQEPSLLAAAYRMALEVISREWKAGRGPAGAGLPGDKGTAEQRKLFLDVRENRFVLSSPGRSIPDAAALLSSPGVAATVLYRMAQSKEIGLRVAPPEFHEPFVRGRVPPGFSPVSVLGPFRNFQTKLLGAWATAVLHGRGPQNLVDLLEIYSDTFPAEKRAVVWTFLATTYGATVKAGGVSSDSRDATQSIAELTALADDVVAGKRALRGPANSDEAKQPQTQRPPRRTTFRKKR